MEEIDPIEFRKNCYLRASLRLISALTNLSLFIFLWIKIIRKSNKSFNLKCCLPTRKITINTFAVSDIQLLFITIYDFISCLFYTALFTDHYSTPHKESEVNEENRPEGFDMAWGFMCVFCETGSLITYSLFAIYTVVVMLKAIIHTKRINSLSKNNKQGCSLNLCVSDKTLKIIFMCIQTILPFLCAFIPLLIKKGYVFSVTTTWPFITDDDGLSIIFYYDFVIIALIMTIIQLIVTIIKLVSINRLNTILNEQIQRQAINKISQSSDDDADNFNILDMDNDETPQTEKTSQNVSRIVESVNKKARRERMMFFTAMFKNIGFAVCYLIEWSISLSSRMVLFAHNEKGGANTYYPSKSLATAFAIGGPSLSFLNATFYYLRLGIMANKMKKNKRHTKQVVVNIETNHSEMTTGRFV